MRAGRDADIELLDPSPTQARRAISDLVATTEIGPADVAGLRLAVSEIVTNAVLHGRPPVVVRAWLESDDCVVVTVRDAGSGPRHPVTTDAGGDPDDAVLDGGRGLRIAAASCTELTSRRTGDGFVVRLVMKADGR